MLAVQKAKHTEAKQREGLRQAQRADKMPTVQKAKHTEARQSEGSQESAKRRQDAGGTKGESAATRGRLFGWPA
jgi:hypothetical protein